MKQHIKSLPHHPKRVIIISLIVAIVIGAFGYIKINQRPSNKIDESAINNKSIISKDQNLSLGFLSGGRIKAVNVKTGDKVKNGDILATLDAGNVSGALIQAKAAYDTAKANYEKVINGATSVDITAINSSVEIAKATLIHNKETLVLTLNNSLTFADNAVHNNTNDIFTNPDSKNPELITSNTSFTNQELEDTIVNERISLNEMFPLWKQELSGLNTLSDLNKLTNDSLTNLHNIAKYLEDLNSLFTLYTPNTTAGTKLTISNILSAQTSVTNQITLLTTVSQSVSSAESNLEQSQAVFNQKVSKARPEDIAIAKAQLDNASGAVQIAEAAFENTIIKAPSDGTILSVAITPGQIAIPNSPAIEFLAENLEIK